MISYVDKDSTLQLPRRTKKLTLARSVFSRRAGLLKHLVRHEHDNMRRTRRHEDRQPSHQTNFGLCSGCLASSKRDRLKKRAPCKRRACSCESTCQQCRSPATRRNNTFQLVVCSFWGLAPWLIHSVVDPWLICPICPIPWLFLLFTS